MSMESECINSPLASPTQNPQRNNTYRKFPKFKVLNINFQSVRNKNAELHTLLDFEHPDIVCGTESWLTPDISDSEIIPQIKDIPCLDRTGLEVLGVGFSYLLKITS